MIMKPTPRVGFFFMLGDDELSEGKQKSSNSLTFNQLRIKALFVPNRYELSNLCG